MSNSKKMIEAKIGGKKVMVFAKSYCPFCKKAKKVLEECIKNGELRREDYEAIDIEDDPDMEAIQEELKRMTGVSTVPRVFINGKCIGGGDETVVAYESGKLKQLLAA